MKNFLSKLFHRTTTPTPEPEPITEKKSFDHLSELERKKLTELVRILLAKHAEQKQEFERIETQMVKTAQRLEEVEKLERLTKRLEHKILRDSKQNQQRLEEAKANCEETARRMDEFNGVYQQMLGRVEKQPTIIKKSW